MDKDRAPRFVSRAQLKGAFLTNAERHGGNNKLLKANNSLSGELVMLVKLYRHLVTWCTRMLRYLQLTALQSDCVTSSLSKITSYGGPCHIGVVAVGQPVG